MAAHLLLLSPAATAGQRDAAFPSGDEGLDAQASGRLAATAARAPYADRRFVSPAASARATAAALGVDAEPAPALAECDHGRWRGLRLAEVEAREPEALARWLTDPEQAPHGGESVATLVARVDDWLNGQFATRGVTLAVAPPSVVRAALAAALACGPAAFWRFDVAPLTLARLSGHGGRWNIAGLTPLEAS